jgi:hypothetical protein
VCILSISLVENSKGKNSRETKTKNKCVEKIPAGYFFFSTRHKSTKLTGKQIRLACFFGLDIRHANSDRKITPLGDIFFPLGCLRVSILINLLELF